MKKIKWRKAGGDYWEGYNESVRFCMYRDRDAGTFRGWLAWPDPEDENREVATLVISAFPEVNVNSAKSHMVKEAKERLCEMRGVLP